MYIMYYVYSYTVFCSVFVQLLTTFVYSTYSTFKNADVLYSDYVG